MTTSLDESQTQPAPKQYGVIVLLLGVLLAAMAVISLVHQHQDRPAGGSSGDASGCAYAKTAVDSGDTTGIDMSWYNSECR